MTVLIFYRQPKPKKRHEKKRAWMCQGKTRETERQQEEARDQPGYGPKEFQSLPSPRSFSNLRAVALNSCKYLSNVRLTGVHVYEEGKKEETRKRGSERRKGKEKTGRRGKILEVGRLARKKPFMVFLSESFRSNCFSRENHEYI